MNKIVPITSECEEPVVTARVEINENINEISISPTMHGEISGPAVKSNYLWKDAPAAIFVFRRPGCPLCRLDGKIISDMFEREFSGSAIKLVGIVKEVAPIAGALTDDLLGVETLQTKFFNNNQIFYDKHKKFYDYLGNHHVLSQRIESWNPCKLYSDYKTLNGRLRENQIDDYNWVGEAYTKGGFLLVCPKDGVVYQYQEMTGYELPLDEIYEAVANAQDKYLAKPRVPVLDLLKGAFRM